MMDKCSIPRYRIFMYECVRTLRGDVSVVVAECFTIAASV